MEIKLDLTPYENRSSEHTVRNISFVNSGNSYDEGKIEVTVDYEDYDNYKDLTFKLDKDELIELLEILKAIK